ETPSRDSRATGRIDENGVWYRRDTARRRRGSLLLRRRHQLVGRFHAPIDLFDGLPDLCLPALVRRRGQLLHELGAREAQRFESADQLGIADWLRVLLRPFTLDV